MEKNRKKRLVSPHIQENIAYLHKKLGVGKSFDVIQLDVEYAGRAMSLFMIDGFVKDDILHYLMRRLSFLEEEELQVHPLEKLLKTYIPYVELSKTNDLDEAVDAVLAGPTALVIDGVEYIILIDARTNPVRGPQ